MAGSMAPAATAPTTPPAAPASHQLLAWDDNQTASYQSCADAFHKANPNITVKIKQTAWDSTGRT